MKAVRTFPLILLALVAILVAVAMMASAGTVDDPEVTDTSGDSTTNRESHDIIKAWIEDEDNTTIIFRVSMTTLDVVSPRDDWFNLPTSIYEYYFTVSDKDYAMRAVVPVHGPFAALASFSLHEVTYGNAGNISYESVDDSIGGSYIVNVAAIELLVDKSTIGSPSQGEIVSHMWAACYFQPRGGTKETVDEAMSYAAPGRDYTIRGKFSQLYDVRLRAANNTVPGLPREISTFNITIVSHSTTGVDVNITINSLPPGYFINITRAMPISVPQEDSVSFLLMVEVPENATNGTDVMVVIRGEYYTEEGELLTTYDLNLLVMVRFIPPKPPVVEETIPQKIMDFLRDHYGLIILVIIIGIVAGLYYYRREVQQKKRDQMLFDYQSYVDTQSYQRDTGGV